jgi:hypothetical protein
MSTRAQKEDGITPGTRDSGGNGTRPEPPALEGDDVAREPEGKDSLESKRRTRNGVRRRFITY